MTRAGTTAIDLRVCKTEEMDAMAKIDDAGAADAGAATGSCLCGTVRFAIRGPLRSITTCHCTMCRRATTSVGAYTSCAANDLRIEGGDPRWFRSSPIAERGFCAACGSQLFWRRIGADKVSISAGSLDDPSTLAWGEHIFVEGSER